MGGGGPSPRQHPPPCCAGSLRRGCQIHRQVMASRPACGGTPPSRTSGRRGRGLKGGGGREDDLDKKQTGMWPPAIWVWIDRPTGGGSGQLPSPCGRRGGAQTACRRVGFFKQTFQRCGTNRARRAPLDRFFCAHARGATPARWDGWEGEVPPLSSGVASPPAGGRGEARTGLVTRHRLLSLSPPPPLPPGRWAGQPVSLAKRALAPQQLWLAPPHSRACKAPRCTCSVQQGPPTRPCQAAVRPTPW